MGKMTQCKVCSKEIASNAKSCPGCGAKISKKFYKRWWFWAIIVIAIFIGAIGGNDSSDSNLDTSTKKELSQNEKTKEKVPAEEKTEAVVSTEEKIPTEYKSALKKAKIYSDTMNMSKAGLYDQLTSEYGEKFAQEAAQYAIDNVEADWKENALKKAHTYQESMSMSPSAIYDQLISEYGEKFTQEEAQYAIDNLE